MSAESLLPWGSGTVATADYRDIVMVAGIDPYAHKGLESRVKAHIRPDGLGNWWQFDEPRRTPEGGIGVTQRKVTEVSHRLLDEKGNQVIDWPPAVRRRIGDG